ncbi:ABC transporter permease [Candidatus Azambacteria bacterium]|nr:ABC transporter permease [Candidatus Azambacteria bacterium]
MFYTRRMRTFLTILGIGIGIGAILFLVSLGYGLQRALLSQITSSAALLSLDVVQGEKTVAPLDGRLVEKIKAFPEVTEVVPMVSSRGQISFEDTTADVVVSATSALFLNLSNIKASVGSEFLDNRKEVIISDAISKSIDLKEGTAIIGAQITLSMLAATINEEGIEQLNLITQPEKFSIVGIIEGDSSPTIFVPISQLTGVNFDSYSQIKVKVGSTDQLEPVRNRIIEMGFVVAALSDIVDQANKVFNILQIILAIFGVVALVVSAIGMFNTMTIALMERTHEVGIMKSLGAARSDIMSMFVTEAVIMGFLGGIVGLIVGFFGGQFFNFLLNILAKNLGGKTVDIFYTPLWFAVTIVIFSTVVGFVTGVWPARRAARLNPLEAVKYK